MALSTVLVFITTALAYAPSHYLSRILSSPSLRNVIAPFFALSLRAVLKWVELLLVRQIMGRTRGNLTATIYSKLLRTPQGTEAVHLLTDVDKLADIWCLIPYLLVTPFEIGIGVVLLYRQLGSSAFVGLLLLPFTFVGARKLSRVHAQENRSRNFYRDSRVPKLDELIRFIRQLKLSGYQEFWLKELKKIRELELGHLLKAHCAAAGVALIWELSVPIMACLSFLAYTTIEGKTLSVSIVFTSLSVFQMFSYPLITIAEAFRDLIPCEASLMRLEEYLRLEDVSPSERAQNRRVGFAAASFTFSGPTKHGIQPKLALKKLHVDFPIGKITLIIGSSGSGKTSLLRALLSELYRVEGEVYLSSSVAYCSQLPWLCEGTVRDNILFGTVYDEHRYRMTIDVCALGPDLEGFPEGDLTRVSEGARNLSGGQKARICLARALYSSASTLLLDSPFEALDTRTAAHIAASINSDIWRDRTVLLVSQSVELCRQFAQKTIRLESGSIVEVEMLSPTSPSQPALSPSSVVLPVYPSQGSDVKAKASSNGSKATGSESGVWTFFSVLGKSAWLVLLLLIILEQLLSGYRH
ncbi:P-loop containing nucleoside triphosphate hydrolase protein [Atractiella rhizophila]|nr:P-loop containing nucleoside triphosphate hydrolase protein [Atractiella rhizophila]